jgi:hypothetical protein
LIQVIEKPMLSCFTGSMNTGSLSEFQQFEPEWAEATGHLQRCELALGEAMRAYRRHSRQCTTSRVAQALANQEEAKQSVHALMEAIWEKLS